MKFKSKGDIFPNNVTCKNNKMTPPVKSVTVHTHTCINKHLDRFVTLQAGGCKFFEQWVSSREKSDKRVAAGSFSINTTQAMQGVNFDHLKQTFFLADLTTPTPNANQTLNIHKQTVLDRHYVFVIHSER